MPQGVVCHDAVMQEIELKFQVPPARQAAVAAAVAGRAGSATTQRLQAAYFDTPDRALAAAGLALRLRREGRHWVQTLKGSGDDGLTRLEHNVPRPGRGAALPALDLQLHAGTPAGARLEAALRDLPEGVLACRYRTDIRRLSRTLRTRAGTLELAFDRGRILAGDRHLPVCELEIELVRGAPLAVLATARQWVARHGLWWDTRSKAERGDLLARGETIAAARKAAPVALTPDMDVAQGRRVVLAACLDQISLNASQIASGEFGDEHVHQLRVGLRRLRTALRLFDGDAADVPLAAAAAALFRQLGSARDQAAVGRPLQADLQRALDALGLTLRAATLPAASDAPDPVACVRSAATQQLLSDLLLAIQPQPAVVPPGPDLRDALALRLKRWHSKVAADTARFAELDDAARHRLRKRAKRLRYAVEFSAALFDAQAVRRYLTPLRALQEQLGALNDVAVGLDGFRDAAPDDARAAFALGWLAARREALLAGCAPVLRAFAKARRFWKT